MWFVPAAAVYRSPSDIYIHYRYILYTIIHDEGLYGE